MKACAWKYPNSAIAFAATCAAVFECPSPEVMADATSARPANTAVVHATPFWYTVLPFESSASTQATDLPVSVRLKYTWILASRSGTVYVMPGHIVSACSSTPFATWICLPPLTRYLLQRTLRNRRIALDIDGRLLHRTQACKAQVTRVQRGTIRLQPVCVDHQFNRHISLHSTDTSDVEVQLSIIGRENDIEEGGAEAAVGLALRERLGLQEALGGGEGREREERGY